MEATTMTISQGVPFARALARPIDHTRLLPLQSSHERQRSDATPPPQIPSATHATPATPSIHAVHDKQAFSDETLLLKIANNEEWAMEALYDRYGRYAYSLAYHIVRDTTIAEDIVQDAFLAIWRKATSYQERQGSVRGWLQAIVHHRAIDRVRAAAHRDHQWTPLPTEGEQDLPSTQPEVWEEAWLKERSELVRKVLAQLPPEQRQVIELAYFGGYTHAEMAERWNIPLGTVKGRMRLGLRKMKSLLHELGFE
jgi:RNA polymerase sigma-70 factor (ECF subfamily)